MTQLSPLDRDILFLMFVGYEVSADHRLPPGERYQLAGQCLPATRVRALQLCGLIRSTGKHNHREALEITQQGRFILTAPVRSAASLPVLPGTMLDRTQPPLS